MSDTAQDRKLWSQDEPVVYSDFTARCHVCGVLTEYVDGHRVDDRCPHRVGVIYDVKASEDDVDHLLDLDAHDFRRVVSDDAKGELQQTLAAALRHDDVLDRWDEALTGLLVDVNAQLAAKKGDKAARGWRGAAMRYQSGLAERRKECKHLTADRNYEERTRKRHDGPSRRERKEMSRPAGERAVERLIQAHKAEFHALLIEEHERDGLPVKPQWRESAC
jgi:hypothetical protein